MTLITGLDTETTGLDPHKGERIIELCIKTYHLETRSLRFDETWRINPQGQRINAAAQKVHGIMAHELIGKPNFDKVAPKLKLILERSAGMVAHNAMFDAEFIAVEMARCELEMPNITIFDTMQEGMFASYDQKPPSLRELCWAMGIHYDTSEAHAADYDVDVMMQAFFAGIDLGYFDVSSLIEKEAA